MPIFEDIRLDGNWKAGWAIELHTLKSVPTGPGCFDTTYTETGEALNRLKYHGDRSQISVLANKAADFMETRLVTPYLDVILPVPPSNEDRPFQPVYEIARLLGARLEVPVDLDYIRKAKGTRELKSITDKAERTKILKGAFHVRDVGYRDKKVLLFDDLYRSGATLKAVTNVLYQQGKARDVYVLALTKTRSKK